jgi:hypothetical protein
VKRESIQGIEKLVASKINGDPPDKALSRWLDALPKALREGLCRIHLLDSTSALSGVTLARHSTITLTMDRYSHADFGKQTEAVEALPSLAAATVEALRATGTDDATAVGVLPDSLAVRDAVKPATPEPGADTDDSDADSVLAFCLALSDEKRDCYDELAKISVLPGSSDLSGIVVKNYLRYFSLPLAIVQKRSREYLVFVMFPPCRIVALETEPWVVCHVNREQATKILVCVLTVGVSVRVGGRRCRINHPRTP